MSKDTPDDLLSLVLDDLHLGEARFLFFTGANQWAAHVSLPRRAVFHAVLSGSVDCWVNNSCITLQGGDILMMLRPIPHRLCTAGLTETLPETDLSDAFGTESSTPMALGEGLPDISVLTASASFDLVMAQPLLDALPSAFRIAGRAGLPPMWLQIGVQFLHQELSHQRPGHQFILNRLGDIWFLECLRTHIESLPTADGTWLRAMQDPALARVLAHVHAHPERPWTVPVLAELAHLSRSAFADRFLRIMGEPPLTYLTGLRLRRAQWQLTHTAQPICHIAEAVGYSSETAFGQAFKRHQGVSPSQYRNRQRLKVS